MFFAGISGAAVADVAALGPIEIKMMKEAKYDTDFSAAVTLSSSMIGPIIPPSLIAIIYGTTLDVSIGGLFAAGFIPGIILGLSLITLCYFIAKKRDYPRNKDPLSIKAIVIAFKETVLALFMPLIILGGILGGVFTPTEAGAVAVGYALIISFIFYDLKISHIPKLFVDAAKTTGFIIWIIACANVLAWVVNTQHLPEIVEKTFFSITKNPIGIVLTINAVMLVIGMFLDINAAIIIFCPIIAPTLYALGFDPLHVGMMMVLNLSLGMATPPFGTTLFLTCNIANISIEKLSRAVAPFLILEIAVLVLIAIFPEISLLIPRIGGF
jgi:C4-dicarboxylate transporter DctM subunit